jgi:hypothetical protein
LQFAYANDAVGSGGEVTGKSFKIRYKVRVGAGAGLIARLEDDADVLGAPPTMAPNVPATTAPVPAAPVGKRAMPACAQQRAAAPRPVSAKAAHHPLQGKNCKHVAKVGKVKKSKGASAKKGSPGMGAGL